MSYRDLTPRQEVTADDAALAELVRGDRATYHTEKRYVRADGKTVWVALSVSAVRNHDGRLRHLISQMQDITARKAAEQKLERLALHDPLTGLANRVLFTDRVERAIARNERETAPIAVFFIDLDRFKLVNDTLGHGTGDRLLLSVADRLVRQVRPTDTISRFGGDEFTILCHNSDEERAGHVARRILESLSEPFSIDGRELTVDASIGIAICRRPGVRAETMVRDADAAMYIAKEGGGARYAIFEGGMLDTAPVVGWLPT
jgi:diguanylate cyclase (GGDEF)-like protein